VINWLSKSGSVALFNLRTFRSEKGPRSLPPSGFAASVAVLVGVLSIAEGFRAAIGSLGPDDVAVVLAERR